ncbi:thiamine pyrophosphate-dependent enzyme [Pseudomonadota bacterium]
MTRTYQTGHPIWCAGCGHFGVQGAILHAMKQVGVELHETLVLAGIGCSGTVQNNIGAYGYHSMHGRVLPTAIGASLANPDLTVIASGGDGDGYAIGGGHLMHGLKRNPNLLYVVMNNGIYGLTKGQDSPTKEVPIASPDEDPLDVMMLGLSIRSTTFLARAITTRSDQLNDLMVQGLNHTREGKGMAFIEVLSPCVTYNDTYPQWMNKVYDLDDDPEYRNDDRGKAFFDVHQLVQQDRIPIGLVFHGEHASLQSSLLSDMTPHESLDEQHSARSKQHMKDVLAAYAV